MKTSEKTGDIIKSLCKLQSKLKTLAKDTKAYKYNYTTLDTIWESFRPMLEELGLVVLQDVTQGDDGQVKVKTRIHHTSDQWIESDYLEIPMGKRDPHTTGSAASYGRRYSLSALLGIVTGDDDDGAKAMEGGPAKALAKNVSMPKWIKQQAEEMRLDVSVINTYIDGYCKHYNIDAQEAVNQLAGDTAKFRLNFSKWYDQNQV